MISHDKIWGIVEFQKNCRFSFEGTQIIVIPCSKSTTGRYRKDQVRASHQEERRSKISLHSFHSFKRNFSYYLHLIEKPNRMCVSMRSPLYQRQGLNRNTLQFYLFRYIYHVASTPRITIVVKDVAGIQEGKREEFF